MIFQCFLPANRTFGRFIPPGDVKSNTFQKRSLKQQIASDACPSTANFQWYLIASCHPFFNLFALRIQRCSKPWSISSCDLYFWKAACHVFNASTPLWCSCFPFLNLFFSHPPTFAVGQTAHRINQTFLTSATDYQSMSPDESLPSDGNFILPEAC